MWIWLKLTNYKILIMSQYIFKLTNYQAVEEAEIQLDGLTVIAGKNGSGKSTVARWLYFVVKSLNSYFDYIEKLTQRKLKDVARKILNARLNVERLYSETDYHNLNEMLRNRDNDFYDYSNARDFFSSALDSFLYELEKELSKIPDKQVRDNNLLRVFNNFALLDSDGTLSMDAVFDNIRNIIDARINNILEERERWIKDFSSDNLSSVIFDNTDPQIDKEDETTLAFIEDGVELLIGDRFQFPLNLRRAVYFDTKKIGSELENGMDSNLSEMLYNSNADYILEDGAKVVIEVIRKIIGGSVTLEKPLFSIPNSKSKGALHFVNNRGLNIYLKAAATGVISFSIILRLIENGWITRDSILIIDEPETHLHPQWIVEYARMLVLICKYIGAKVLVSSHNPEMVSAIHDISESNGILDKVNFYLAEDSKNSSEEVNGNQYIFKPLGSDISPIFDSFNLAFDRIAFYAPPKDERSDEDL